MATASDQTTSIIEIYNGGPIVYSEIPLLSDGGLVVLHGRNGAGKTQALEAIGSLCGADPIEVHDGETEGSISLGAASVRFGKRTRRINTGEDRLGLVHVEDRYDLAKLVNPGIKDPESADAERIKALVQLSGVQIGWEQFESLIPAGEDIPLAAARECKDPVTIAAKVKRAFNTRAFDVEKSVATEDVELQKLEDGYKGVDLTLVDDRNVLQSSLKDAVSAKAKIDEQIAAHENAKAARAKAETALAEAGHSPTGLKTVEEAKSDMQAADAVLAACRADVADLEAKLAAAKAAQRDAEAKQAVAKANLSAAESHRRVLAQWDATLAADIPEPPSEDDVRFAAKAVEEAESAIEAGIRVRAAKMAKEKAEAQRKKVRQLADRAEQLRTAARRVDDVLAAAVKSEDLTVQDGRLVVRGTGEPFSRLSDGQRYAIAFRIGEMRVGEKDGDGTRILRLSQDGFQHLDFEARDRVWALAKKHKITVYTAICDKGDLRAEIYQPTTDNAEALASV